MKTVTTITRKFDERDNCIEEVKTYVEVKEEAVEPKKEVVEKAKTEYYSGNVTCTKSGRAGLTFGKVYTIDNGYFMDDDCVSRPLFGPIKNLANEWFTDKVIAPIVGEQS
jgi:hypothetical protein